MGLLTMGCPEVSQELCQTQPPPPALPQHHLLPAETRARLPTLGEQFRMQPLGCKTPQIGHSDPKSQGSQPLPAQLALPKAPRA